MADVIHKNMTGADLHEPKGISTATNGQINVANGDGTTSWITPETIDPLLIEIPVGAMVQYAGSTAPSKWMLCYGQAISRSTYSDLFTAIGTTYGAGNGTTTFNLPDLRGRTIAGKDDMGGSSANRLTSPINGDNLGAAGGAQNYVLLAADSPVLSGTTSSDGAHTHTMTGATNLYRWIANAGNGGGNTGVVFVAATISLSAAGDHTHGVTVNTTSTSLAHTNMQPSIVFNTIIYTGVA